MLLNNYSVSSRACDIIFNQELIPFYFNIFHGQGLLLFLDTPALCTYHSSKEHVKPNLKDKRDERFNQSIPKGTAPSQIAPET